MNEPLAQKRPEKITKQAESLRSHGLCIDLRVLSGARGSRLRVPVHPGRLWSGYGTVKNVKFNASRFGVQALGMKASGFA